MGQTQTQFKVGDPVRAKFIVSGHVATYIRTGVVTKVLPRQEVLEVRLDEPLDKSTPYEITCVYALVEECSPTT